MYLMPQVVSFAAQKSLQLVAAHFIISLVVNFSPLLNLHKRPTHTHTKRLGKAVALNKIRILHILWPQRDCVFLMQLQGEQ